jgi:hypothetical protein
MLVGQRDIGNRLAYSRAGWEILTRRISGVNQFCHWFPSFVF